MSHLTKNFGIVCDPNGVSIFDTDSLTVLHNIKLDAADSLDVVITPDSSKALVTSFYNQKLYIIDLTQEPPIMTGSIVSPSTMPEDIDITFNGRFAVITDAGAGYIESYDLQTNSFVSKIDFGAGAVAISQNNDSKVYTVNIGSNTFKVSNIDTTTGILTDPNIEVSSYGVEPINIVLSRDSKFAFVINRALFSPGISNVVVFDISGPIPIFLTSMPLPNNGQSAVLSYNPSKLYVLTGVKDQPIGTVEIFNFIPSPPYLIHDSTIHHNLPVAPFVGVDQLALNYNETILFISSSYNIYNGNVLAAYNTDGTFIGNYPDIVASGAVVTNHYSSPAPCQCCFVDEKPVVYAKCELEKSESFNDITVNCTGRFLDVNVTLTGVCPNKLVNVGVLVYENDNLLSLKVCKLTTDNVEEGCISSQNAGTFCFVFDDDSCPPERTLTVRVVANYLERL